MLDINTVRINGYKNGKRTHVDIKVENMEVLNKIVPRVPHYLDIAYIGFKNGLDGVTSYNYYNWVANERYTEKIS